jgi:hypothetical protein
MGCHFVDQTVNASSFMFNKMMRAIMYKKVSHRYSCPDYVLNNFTVNEEWQTIESIKRN